MLRFLTAGESHGPGLTLIVDGMPAGVPVTALALDRDLARRQAGHGRGGRMAIERDRVQLRSGVRHGLTTGAPIAVTVENRDYASWQAAMHPEPLATDEIPPDVRHRQPRPGHADLAGALMLLSRDARNVLERASARNTVARVVAGGLGKALLATQGVSVVGHVLAIGTVTAQLQTRDLARLAADSESSPVRCADADATLAMTAAIDSAAAAGDTLGGRIEVLADGLPPGLGHFAEWDRRLDGILARALMSVPSVKAVEIGDGLAQSAGLGSAAHDVITYDAAAKRYRHASNHAGGIEGGMSNGERLVLRAALKPIPTLGHPLPSIDLETHATSDAARVRSDVCIVPAAAVVCEAVVAWELCAAFLERFGGVTLGEVGERLAQYAAALEAMS